MYGKMLRCMESMGITVDSTGISNAQMCFGVEGFLKVCHNVFLFCIFEGLHICPHKENDSYF